MGKHESWFHVQNQSLKLGIILKQTNLREETKGNAKIESECQDTLSYTIQIITFL